MPLYQAILLALVQALTEFLPISSTAHLFLFPWLLGWDDPGLTFTIAVHAGTLVGVLLYFLRTWVKLTLSALGIAWPAGTPPAEAAASRKMFWLLVLATIPAAIFGYTMERSIETTFRSPVLMAVMLIGFGLLLGWADARGRRVRGMESVTLADALIIGAAQAAALVPGVSRSGATITAGMFLGMTREAAARFTFLLSTPIIAGAAFKRFLDLRATPMDGDSLTALIVGTVVAAISGYAVIHFFLRYLQTRTLRFFVYYRIGFGIVILLLAFLHGGAAR